MKKRKKNLLPLSLKGRQTWVLHRASWICLCFGVRPESFIGLVMQCWPEAFACQGLAPSDSCHVLDALSAVSPGSRQLCRSSAPLSHPSACHNFAQAVQFSWHSLLRAVLLGKEVLYLLPGILIKAKAVKEHQGKSWHRTWHRSWGL